MTARDDALAALRPEWETAREINKRTGWCTTTIRHQLNCLAIEGAIDRESVETTTGFMWRYRARART